MSRRPAMAFLLAMIVACRNATDAPGPLDDGQSEVLREAVRGMFMQQFGEPIPRPTFYVDPQSAACTGPSYLTAVAYLRVSGNTTLTHVMHLTHDGLAPALNHQGISTYSSVIGLRPAGVFRVLTVVLTYPETVSDRDLAVLSQQQSTINQQHAAFAQSKGYAAPIVRFEFTNVSLPGTPGSAPRSLSATQELLQGHGISTVGYEFVEVINIDPTRSEGGFAVTSAPAPPFFIYMGNYSAWSARPTESGFYGIARATYHHEVAHHWGWQHEWTTSCGSGDPPFTPFITAPVLFGWLDADGDGVPEILDTTPYGRH